MREHAVLCSVWLMERTAHTSTCCPYTGADASRMSISTSEAGPAAHVKQVSARRGKIGSVGPA